MKLIKNILFKLIIVIMVCIVSFNLYNFICLNVLKENLATVNGYAVLEVVSGSMEPTIHVGDMIIIDTKVENFERNDIITFYDVNGAFVTHRIININGNKMVTKGDNNDSPDEEMSTTNIAGKVVKIIPAAGKIMASLKSPLVMVLILVIGVLICFLTSTDDDLVPVDLTDEEKEFLEYKKTKMLQAKEKNVNFVDYTEKKKRTKKVSPKEEPKKKKTSKVEGTKKSSTKKTTKNDTKKETTKDVEKKVTKKSTPKVSAKKNEEKVTEKKVAAKKDSKKTIPKKDDVKTIKKSTKKVEETKKNTKK